ncbi:MAG: RNA polymerase sigma factor [Candidatus Pacebacteria bacterium]|nr:RNA polymerase sigma factor [Candidatus Paceibacterota bacterium]
MDPKLSNTSDEEIIILYKNGDPEVFKTLIDRYSSPLYNFTARLTNEHDAPDIVQNTFIKAWKNIHKFDPSKGVFKTWIFTIAKNVAIDFLRKKKVLNFSELDKDDDPFSEKIPDENLLPVEVLQKLEDSRFLNKLLEQLPLHYKTVLVLYYQEDITFEEIGKILGKPLNTVKSHHRRAIMELRRLLS